MTLFRRKSALVIIGVGCLFWVSIIVAYFDPGALAPFDLLPFLALFFALPLTAAVGIYNHGFFSRAWLLLPGLCIFFFFGFACWLEFKVHFLDDWLFERELSAYAGVVNGVKSGTIKTGDGFKMLDSQIRQYPGRARRIFATSCSQGTAIVEFFIPSGGGAVGPHGGYLFNDCADPAKRAIKGDTYAEKYSLYHLHGAWYEFDD